MTNGWSFSSADIPQAFLYASIEEGRHVYLRPPKICVDFGLVPANTLWKLKRALYGLRESPKLWEKKRDTNTWDKYQSKKKTTVRIREASTVIGDQTAMDDLLCAANTDVIHSIQTSVDTQWKTGAFRY
eukprot:1195209-Amphidinium_carterae.1